MARLFYTCVLALWCALSPAGAAQPVRVGAYPFLPFVDGTTGLTVDLIKEMNAFQKDYRFELVPTSANRRYRDMANGLFSMVLFEHIKWGWDANAVTASKPFLVGDGEVYVTLGQPGRDQSYFDNLTDKQLLVVLGYHYGFTGFEADQAVLQKRFRMVFSQDNAVSLRNLLAGRGDVAVITKSYLALHLLQHPEDRDKLLVSERMDQSYAHTVVVKKGSKPSAHDMDALLARMEAAGILKRLWNRYGM
jgi:polar amino acid transport system substrate-binding protein